MSEDTETKEVKPQRSVSGILVRVPTWFAFTIIAILTLNLFVSVISLVRQWDSVAVQRDLSAASQSLRPLIERLVK